MIEDAGIYYMIKMEVTEKQDRVTLTKIERKEERVHGGTHLFIKDGTGTPYRFDKKEDAIDWLNINIERDYIDREYYRPDQQRYLNQEGKQAVEKTKPKQEREDVEITTMRRVGNESIQTAGMKKETTSSFPQFAEYFIGMIGTRDNVYQTFQATVPYLREPLKTRVELFIVDIKEGNDYEKYQQFAEYIGTSEAYTVMRMIYNISVNGLTKDNFYELKRTIKGIKENNIAQMVTTKTTELDDQVSAANA